MIEIIPAIDLIDGKCVRLRHGDFDQATVYGDDPVETAQRFADAGLCRLHIVDLDGARTGKISNLRVLESITKQLDLVIDFGGGIKSADDLKAVFDAGAAMANIGSMAVKSPEKFFAWIEHCGSERILLGADVRDRVLAIDGWQTVTSVEIIPFLLEYFAKRVRQAFVTDVAKDGVLEGPSFDLYREIREALPDLKLIASGGVRSMADIRELEAVGCDGVIVGRAIYEGGVTLGEIAKYVG